MSTRKKSSQAAPAGGDGLTRAQFIARLNDAIDLAMALGIDVPEI